jgi:Na+/H+-dicarboxylate symporter/ABC-type amino acid transport substrate-binding protein
MGLTGWILAGFVAGVGCGLFFGEQVAFLDVLGDAFIRLLQMAVLPYVVVSLIAALGSLSYREAAFIAKRGGALMLLLWGLTLAVILALPLAYPDWETASFFSTTLVESRPDFDLLGLYIPSNPFESLSRNSVPAVVLFCIATGVALIGVSGREQVVEVLNVFAHTLQRVIGFVVRLTPVGVFAIAASAAGTMTIDDFERLQVHVATYLVGALLVVFWVLPGLVSALSPLRARDVLRASRDALVTAFSTGSTFVILPMLAEASKQLLEGRERGDEAAAVTDVIVPVSFNFPHAGRLFALGFVLFAAWFTETDLSPADHAALAVTGLVSLFGQVNVAVPFLLDLFRIPADMFQLFVAVGVFESRVATLLAAMHILVLALLSSCAAVGMLRFRAAALLRYLAITAALTALAIGGARVFLGTAIEGSFAGRERVTGRAPALPVVESLVHETPPPLPEVPPAGRRLADIRERGVLRISYAPGFLPFSYRNDAGQLVGHDVDLVNDLARELRVALEFVPRVPGRTHEDMASGAVDLAVTSAATPTDAEQMALSRPYMDFALGFVVRDHRRQAFASRVALRQQVRLRVAVARSRYYEDRLREYLPDAEVVLIRDERDFFEQEDDRYDAMLHGAEFASPWTLLYPRYTVVVPQPDVVKGALSFALPRGEPDLALLVDRWIDLKERDGTLRRLYDYWILGRDPEQRTQRWSVVRDVLHWVD